MSAAKKLSNSQLMAARSLWNDLPYRALVPIRKDGNGTMLYRVAGSAQGECGPETALKIAFEVYGGSCYLCAKRIAKADLSVDHIEPRASGGCGSLQNIALAHKSCNQAKGSKRIECYSPEVGREWFSAIHRNIAQRLKADEP